MSFAFARRSDTARWAASAPRRCRCPDRSAGRQKPATPRTPLSAGPGSRCPQLPGSQRAAPLASRSKSRSAWAARLGSAYGHSQARRRSTCPAPPWPDGSRSSNRAEIVGRIARDALEIVSQTGICRVLGDDLHHLIGAYPSRPLGPVRHRSATGLPRTVITTDSPASTRRSTPAVSFLSSLVATSTIVLQA